jgi:hypothetical protein
MLGVANALAFANDGLKRADASDPQGGVYSLIVALRLQQSDFKCAAEYVAPFVSNGDSTIHFSATAMHQIFQRLGDLDGELVSLLKTMDSTTGDGRGDLADKQAQIQTNLEQTWGLLVDAVVLSSYSVISADPLTGRMSRTKLSRGQTKEILELFRASFGNSILGGAREGQHPVVAAAAMLYKTINERKCANCP